MHYKRCACTHGSPKLIRLIEEVACVEQVPAPIIVSKWMRIDGERTTQRICKRPVVVKWPAGVFALCYPQLMQSILLTDRIVEPPRAASEHDFRGPKCIA